jgi:fluoride exporter
MDRYACILLGAALGGVARYAAGAAIAERYGSQFPWGTLTVNMSGCFLIGLIMTVLQRTGAHSNWGFFLVTGLLGGYTTFSSFGWETYVLLRGGFLARALLNALASTTAGCLAAWCGVFIGKIVR